MNKCSFCSKETPNHWGYHSMILPRREMEQKIDKWGRLSWWEHMKRTDLTEDETRELELLSTYDQMLNTVGRGYQCDDCTKLENELYNKYYPEQSGYPEQPVFPSITLKERVVGVLKIHSIEKPEDWSYIIEQRDFEELADNLIKCFEQFGSSK
jgi:hypothetical protein